MAATSEIVVPGRADGGGAGRAAVRGQHRDVRRDVGLRRRPARAVPGAAGRRPGDARRARGRAGIDERYAREWLEQQAATGILDVDDVGAACRSTTVQPPGGVRGAAPGPGQPDLDRAARPLGRGLRQGPAAAPRRRTGPAAACDVGGLRAGHDRGRRATSTGPGCVARSGRRSCPRSRRSTIASLADPPARVADVACGVGWAAIAIAAAYPSVRVDGFDLDASSIELARANAESAGVADRVTFDVRDAADRPRSASTTSSWSSRRSTT